MLCNIIRNMISIPQKQRGLSETLRSCDVGSRFLFIMWMHLYTGEDIVAAAEYCPGLCAQKCSPTPLLDSCWPECVRSDQQLTEVSLMTSWLTDSSVAVLVALLSLVTLKERTLSNDYSLQRISWCFSEWDISKVKLWGDWRVSWTHEELVFRLCKQSVYTESKLLHGN